MKQPNLIQRCFLKAVPSCQYGGRLADFVTFDYMGCAEYEFDAVRIAYRKMADKEDKFRLSTLRSLRSDDESGPELRIYHPFDDQELDGYEAFLLKLRRGHHFPQIVDRPDFIKGSKTQVWFDLDNGCLWSFDRRFMKNTIAMTMRKTFQKFSSAPDQ